MGVQLTGESMQKQERKYDFGYFKLTDNHDKAVVRILHEDYNDFSRRPVHSVKVPENKYKVTVNCLRADTDAESVCPFCAAKLPTEQVSGRRKKVYIEFLVYKIMNRDGKVLEDYTKNPKRMVWERDRRFDDKLFSLSSRYTRLCDEVFQIERFGEHGSTDTQYDIYQISVNKDEYPYELPEKVFNPDGILVKDKTADEMNYYIENGNFPPTGDEGVSRRADVEIQEHPVPDTPPWEEQPVQSTQPTTTATPTRRRSI